MATVLVAIVVLGLAVGLLAVRILLVPGGEFRGTCASNNPFLRRRGGSCWACGKSDSGEIDDCDYRTSTVSGSGHHTRKAG